MLKTLTELIEKIYSDSLEELDVTTLIVKRYISAYFTARSDDPDNDSSIYGAQAVYIDALRHMAKQPNTFKIRGLGRNDAHVFGGSYIARRIFSEDVGMFVNDPRTDELHVHISRGITAKLLYEIHDHLEFIQSVILGKYISRMFPEGALTRKTQSVDETVYIINYDMQQVVLIIDHIDKHFSDMGLEVIVQLELRDGLWTLVIKPSIPRSPEDVWFIQGGIIELGLTKSIEI